jgi:PIN domain nuclease of toxin-antitoxin system
MSAVPEAVLLDSHVLLWWWFDPQRLSDVVRSLLSDPSCSVFVSAASVWELSLKHHQGKLPELATAIADLPALLQADGFQPLAISQAHGLRAGAYPQPHRDPFDRILAAQAELEQLALLTIDPKLATFPCRTLW